MNFEWAAGLSPLLGTVLHTLAWLVLVVWAWRRLRGESLALRWFIVALGAVQVGLYWVF